MQVSAALLWSRRLPQSARRTPMHSHTLILSLAPPRAHTEAGTGAGAPARAVPSPHRCAPASTARRSCLQHRGQRSRPAPRPSRCPRPRPHLAPRTSPPPAPGAPGTAARPSPAARRPRAERRLPSWQRARGDSRLHAGWGRLPLGKRLEVDKPGWSHFSTEPKGVRAPVPSDRQQKLGT